MTIRTLSIVAPCYNEKGSLRQMYERVRKVCYDCVGDNYELVFVNDGSRDNTWELMRDLAASDTHVVAINLSRNFGHQIALTAGLQMARGERVLIIDADLQDPPELLPQMMAQMDQGPDVVFGVRRRREGETAFKKATAHLFYRLLSRLAETEIPEDTGDFRLMSRRAVDILNAMPEHHRFVRGMVSWMGLRQEPLYYERAPRFAGESHYPLSKMVRFALDAITGFSVRPLRIASYLGIGSSLLTILLLIYVLIDYVTGHPVKGWTSLAVIVLTLGSVQLLVVGIVGEYLGRLYMESKGRPLFVIQEVATQATPSEQSLSCYPREGVQ